MGGRSASCNLSHGITSIDQQLDGISSRNSRENSRRVSDAIEIERLVGPQVQGNVGVDDHDDRDRRISFRGSMEITSTAPGTILNILDDSLSLSKRGGDGDDDDEDAVQVRIAKAPSRKVREAAIEMYKLMRQNGLASEAQKAFEAHLMHHDYSYSSNNSTHLNGSLKQYKRSNVSDDIQAGQAVYGVEHMLKHGVVNFLRDLARLSPPIPHQVVRFRGMRYSVEVEDLTHHQFQTFGKKAVDCILGPFKSLFRKTKRLSVCEVLKDVDGYMMPGSTTLLLGPPGSGKSSLLKALAGRDLKEKHVRLKGSVKYNDRDVEQVLRTRFIAYMNGQTNCHLPFLSVRETLKFAEDCTQLGLRPGNFPSHMRQIFAYALVEGEDPYLEYILRVLGLKGIEHELVGKSRKDGIDDAQRNRLTTAEIAMGTYAVMIYDQPYIGQDPVATYDLVHTLRAVNRIQQSCAIISLVQVPAEAFDIFDRVILLGEGHVLYQGPRQDAIHYFSQLGYNKPPHIDSGAFLQNIAGGEGARYLEANCVPHSIDELSELYKNSDLYKDVMRIVTSENAPHTFWVESEGDIQLSFRASSTTMTIANEPQLQDVLVAQLGSIVDHACGIESTARLNRGDKVTGISKPAGGMHYIDVDSFKFESNHQQASAIITSLLQSASGHRIRLQVERQRIVENEEDRTGHEKFEQEYVQGWWQSTWSLISRQWNITRRLKTLILLRCMQVIILGLFGGTIFYHLGGRVDSFKMNSVRGMGFVSSMTVLLINLVQQPLHMLQRPVFYKQRTQRFYRTSSYLVAEAVISLPQSIIEAFLYSMGAYFLASLSRTWAHYFGYLLVLFLTAYLGSSLVRFTSSVAPILEAANALAAALVAIFLLFSGFVIYPHNVPPYWKWMLYANPLHWAILVYGLIQLGENYKEPCSDYSKTLQFCHVYPNMTLGNAFLKFYGLKTERHLVWVGYAIIVAWILLFKLFSFLALTRIQHMEVIPSLPRQKYRAHVYSNLDEERAEGPNSFSRKLSVNIKTRNNLNYHQKANTTQEEAFDEEASKPENGVRLPAADHLNLTSFAVSFLRRHNDPSFEEFDHPQNAGGSIVSHIPEITPITLSFLNISLTVKDPKTKRDKVLVQGVCGYAKPGCMVAFMGSSNFVTTPLLKSLAGRVSQGAVEGDIFVNGTKQNAEIFSRISGYAERLDAHQPYLTVRESLEFSTCLRLREKASDSQKLFLVDLILELMGLSEVSNHLVGELRYSTGRTYELSKKLTIAVELAANPSILFLDNPTSNLDSVGVRNLMFAMKAVAGIGRTVLSTVQHPSASMLSAFDKVLILNNSGQQVYFGPVGWNCRKLVEYFVRIPNVQSYDGEQNPITYVMDLLGGGINVRNTTTIQDFRGLYLESQLGKENAADTLKLCNDRNDDALVISNLSEYAASYQKQAWTVFLRTQRFLYRNVHYTFGRLAGSIALGILLGSVYIQIHWSSTISMTSRSLFIYIQVLLIGVMNANNVIPQLGSDRMAYCREKRAHMYAPIFYPISWALGEIPYLILITLVFVAIGNGMAGIGTDTLGHFFQYWFGLFLFTLAMTYFGIFLTIATPLPMLAAFAMSICLSIWITGSGVVIPKLRIHFYAWLYWCNPFQYAINALTSISFYCNTKSDVCLACPAGQPCPVCPCKQLEDLGYSFVWNRLKYVRSLDHERIPLDFAVLGGLSIVLALLCVLSFVFFKHNNKPSY